MKKKPVVKISPRDEDWNGPVETSVNATTNSTNPAFPVVYETFELNLELGRQDLNDNFKKIQNMINKLMK